MKVNPEYGNDKFKCPHCKVVAQQSWLNSKNLSATVANSYHHIYLDHRGNVPSHSQTALEEFLRIAKPRLSHSLDNFMPPSLAIAVCYSCGDFSLWVDKNIVYPKSISIDTPNEDLDDEIISLYNEAATIFLDSPKGSTALLRLALQKLLIQLGKDGKNINNNIKELVAEGLSPKTQKSLDLLRVVGNNAVHPGHINLDDNSDIALNLFKILNIIADEMITKPREIDEIYDDVIPQDTKEHIEKRDGGKK